jgi:hypothetical protein
MLAELICCVTFSWLKTMLSERIGLWLRLVRYSNLIAETRPTIVDLSAAFRLDGMAVIPLAYLRVSNDPRVMDI